MIIYPAMDILNGSCVRLYKGDFDQTKTYDDAPAEVAKRYADEGAEWLHLVDLDGAKDPNNRQTDVIRDIIGGTDLKVQTGGGIRSRADIDQLLEAGASRIVIGSLAVKDPELVQGFIKSYGPEIVCLAIDITEGQKVAVSGWQESSDIRLFDLLELYTDGFLKHVLCTDIGRDGTMGGVDESLYDSIKRRYPSLHVQASGGVSSLEDVLALKKGDVDGVIIGKALYEGSFTVHDALMALRG